MLFFDGTEMSVSFETLVDNLNQIRVKDAPSIRFVVASTFRDCQALTPHVFRLILDPWQTLATQKNMPQPHNYWADYSDLIDTKTFNEIMDGNYLVWVTEGSMTPTQELVTRQGVPKLQKAGKHWIGTDNTKELRKMISKYLQAKTGAAQTSQIDEIEKIFYTRAMLMRFEKEPHTQTIDLQNVGTDATFSDFFNNKTTPELKMLMYVKDIGPCALSYWSLTPPVAMDTVRLMIGRYLSKIESTYAPISHTDRPPPPTSAPSASKGQKMAATRTDFDVDDTMTDEVITQRLTDFVTRVKSKQPCDLKITSKKLYKYDEDTGAYTRSISELSTNNAFFPLKALLAFKNGALERSENGLDIFSEEVKNAKITIQNGDKKFMKLFNTQAMTEAQGDTQDDQEQQEAEAAAKRQQEQQEADRQKTEAAAKQLREQQAAAKKLQEQQEADRQKAEAAAKKLREQQEAAKKLREQQEVDAAKTRDKQEVDADEQQGADAEEEEEEEDEQQEADEDAQAQQEADSEEEEEEEEEEDEQEEADADAQAQQEADSEEEEEEEEEEDEQQEADAAAQGQQEADAAAQGQQEADAAAQKKRDEEVEAQKLLEKQKADALLQAQEALVSRLEQIHGAAQKTRDTILTTKILPARQALPKLQGEIQTAETKTLPSLGQAHDTAKARLEQAKGQKKAQESVNQRTEQEVQADIKKVTDQGAQLRTELRNKQAQLSGKKSNPPPASTKAVNTRIGTDKIINPFDKFLVSVLAVDTAMRSDPTWLASTSHIRGDPWSQQIRTRLAKMSYEKLQTYIADGVNFVVLFTTRATDQFVLGHITLLEYVQLLLAKQPPNIHILASVVNSVDYLMSKTTTVPTMLSVKWALSVYMGKSIPACLHAILSRASSPSDVKKAMQQTKVIVAGQKYKVKVKGTNNSAAKKAYDAEVATLEAEIQSLEAQIARIDASLNSLNGELAHVQNPATPPVTQKDIDALTLDVANAEKAIQDLNADLNRKRTRLNNLQAVLGELAPAEAAVVSALDQLNAAKQRLDQLKSTSTASDKKTTSPQTNMNPGSTNLTDQYNADAPDDGRSSPSDEKNTGPKKPVPNFNDQEKIASFRLNIEKKGITPSRKGGYTFEEAANLLEKYLKELQKRLDKSFADFSTEKDADFETALNKTFPDNAEGEVELFWEVDDARYELDDEIDALKAVCDYKMQDTKTKKKLDMAINATRGKCITTLDKVIQNIDKFAGKTSNIVFVIPYDYRLQPSDDQTTDELLRIVITNLDAINNGLEEKWGKQADFDDIKLPPRQKHYRQTVVTNNKYPVYETSVIRIPATAANTKKRLENNEAIKGKTFAFQEAKDPVLFFSHAIPYVQMTCDAIKTLLALPPSKKYANTVRTLYILLNTYVVNILKASYKDTGPTIGDEEVQDLRRRLFILGNTLTGNNGGIEQEEPEEKNVRIPIDMRICILYMMTYNLVNTCVSVGLDNRHNFCTVLHDSVEDAQPARAKIRYAMYHGDTGQAYLSTEPVSGVSVLKTPAPSKQFDGTTTPRRRSRRLNPPNTVS